MKPKNKQSHLLAQIVVCLALGTITTLAYAQFDLNFGRFVPRAGQIDEGERLNCNFGHSVGCDVGSGARRDIDPTPVLIEVARDTNRNVYYHMIIGDPDSNFVQEYYIRAGGWINWFNGWFDSASGGGLNGGKKNEPRDYTFIDPLSQNAGNGTGAPNRTIFRQRVRGRGFNQEVRKNSFGRKPRITQRVRDNEMRNTFTADMTNSTYSERRRGWVSSTLEITEEATGELVAEFDLRNLDDMNYGVSGDTSGMNVDVEIRAGLYTYDGGRRFKHDSGNYDYAWRSGYNPDNFDWNDFYDPRQNYSTW